MEQRLQIRRRRIQERSGFRSRKPEDVGYMSDGYEDGSLAGQLRTRLRKLLWWPTFALFLLSSSVMSLLFDSSQKIANTLLISYTFFRLVTGFYFIVLWRLLRLFLHYSLRSFECILRTKHEGSLLTQYREAKTFEEWLDVATRLDALSPDADQWRNTDASNDFDWQLLQLQLETMNIALNSFEENPLEPKVLISAIVNVFRRTFCSLQNQHLYNHLHSGQTKEMIEEYYFTLATCLECIADCSMDSRRITPTDDLDFDFSFIPDSDSDEDASSLGIAHSPRSRKCIAAMNNNGSAIFNRTVAEEESVDCASACASALATPMPQMGAGMSPSPPECATTAVSLCVLEKAENESTDFPETFESEDSSERSEVQCSTATQSEVGTITEAEIVNDPSIGVRSRIGADEAEDVSSAEEKAHTLSPTKMTRGIMRMKDGKRELESIMTINDRFEFFFRCKRSLGRTALCLSGGGALAMAHVGVVRALLRRGCLPKVLSGTSGGAIIAAFVGVSTDLELERTLEPSLSVKYGVRFLPTFFSQITGAYFNRVLMDANEFINSMKQYVGELTFKEAWQKTGRHMSITVSYSTKGAKGSGERRSKDRSKHAHSILLNHITAPDTLIWSAVTASCALPGLMIPQQLCAKGGVPYYPDGVKWVDGSLQADIPLKDLQELFRVNYTIVSQVNPHVAPFLLQEVDLRSQARSLAAAGSGLLSIRSRKSRGVQVLEMLDDMANAAVNHQLDRLVKLRAIPAVYGHNLTRFVAQKYSGDVTIIPRFPLSIRFKLLSHPTEDDMGEYIKIGERATWPHLAHIRDVMRTETLVDKCIDALRAKLLSARRQSAIGKAALATDAAAYNSASYLLRDTAVA